MNNKKKITHSVLALSLFFGMCNLCTANDVTPKTKPLILEIDTTKHLNFSPSESKKHTFEKVKVVKYDNKISKNIKRAKRALNKLTSFKYGKKQKLKAHLGKSSYVLQYTRKL